MALGIYTGVALVLVGGELAPAAGATVLVEREDTNTAAAIFSDRAGTLPLANPLLADAEGRFKFYAAPLPQGFEITVTKDAFSYSLDNQQVHLDARALAVMSDVITTKGDLVAGSGIPGVATRKAVGADGSALVADAAQPDGLLWAPVGTFASTGDAIAYAIALG